jgi:hypothetical protein
MAVSSWPADSAFALDGGLDRNRGTPSDSRTTWVFRLLHNPVALALQ